MERCCYYVNEFGVEETCIKTCNHYVTGLTPYNILVTALRSICGDCCSCPGSSQYSLLDSQRSLTNDCPLFPKIHPGENLWSLMGHFQLDATPPLYLCPWSLFQTSHRDYAPPHQEVARSTLSPFSYYQEEGLNLVLTPDSEGAIEIQHITRAAKPWRTNDVLRPASLI